MIKLMCVTKVILRVPNRRFFPRINLPAQMGQAAHVNWALWLVGWAFVFLLLHIHPFETKVRKKDTKTERKAQMGQAAHVNWALWDHRWDKKSTTKAIDISRQQDKNSKTQTRKSHKWGRPHTSIVGWSLSSLLNISILLRQTKYHKSWKQKNKNTKA